MLAAGQKLLNKPFSLVLLSVFLISILLGGCVSTSAPKKTLPVKCLDGREVAYRALCPEMREQEPPAVLPSSAPLASASPSLSPTSSPSPSPLRKPVTALGKISVTNPLNNSVINGSTKVLWTAESVPKEHSLVVQYSLDFGESWRDVPKPSKFNPDQNIYLDTFSIPDGSKIYLRVIDKDQPQVLDLVASVLVANGRPSAYCGGSYSAKEGESIELNGGESSDGVTKIVRYTWLVNGTELGEGVKYVPQLLKKTKASTYIPVLLNVTNSVGFVTTVSCDIRVANVPPAPSLDGPYAGPEGQNITFTGSFADPGKDNAENYGYYFEFGDGGVAEGALSASHSYRAPGEYSVRFKVFDEESSATTEARVTVANVRPLIESFTYVKSKVVVEGLTMSGNSSLFTWNVSHPPGPVMRSYVQYNDSDEFGRERWNTVCSATGEPYECVWSYSNWQPATLGLRLVVDDGVEPVNLWTGKSISVPDYS